MTKLVFNIEDIRKNVKPSIDATVGALNTASSMANNIDVPSNFLYASDVNNIKSFIDERKTKILSVDECIKNSETSYDDIEETARAYNYLVKPSAIKNRKGLL